MRFAQVGFICVLIGISVGFAIPAEHPVTSVTNAPVALSESNNDANVESSSFEKRVLTFPKKRNDENTRYKIWVTNRSAVWRKMEAIPGVRVLKVTIDSWTVRNVSEESMLELAKERGVLEIRNNQNTSYNLRKDKYTQYTVVLSSDRVILAKIKKIPGVIIDSARHDYWIVHGVTEQSMVKLGKERGVLEIVALPEVNGSHGV